MVMPSNLSVQNHTFAPINTQSSVDPVRTGLQRAREWADENCSFDEDRTGAYRSIEYTATSSPEKTWLTLNNFKLTSLPNLSFLEHVERLDLCDNQLSMLNAEELPPNTEYLDVSGNLLENQPNLSSMNKLTDLTFSNNKLTAFDAAGLPPQIEHLNISENLLTLQPDLARVSTNLSLYLSQNNITELNEKLLPPRIYRLDVANNKLQSVPALDGLQNLTTLKLSNNNIRHLNGAWPQGMDRLEINSNPIQGQLSDFPSRLRYLNISNTRITHLPALPASMTILLAYDSGLKALPAEKPAGLRCAALYGTELTEADINNW